MDNFKSIVVAGKPVKVVKNPTSYPLIGKGEQGAVFKLSQDRCVKIYAETKYALREGEVLKIGQSSPIIPKLYEVGTNYIVMEYIEGPSLREHLKSTGFISEALVEQILFVLKEMERLKFTRLDANLRHIIVSKEGNLKVIDHVNSFRIKSLQPNLLFEGLKKLKLLSSFLEQVKKKDPHTYKMWKNK